MTIDELARMMSNQFKDQNKDMNAGFDRLDKRIDGLEIRIDGLDKRIDGLEVRFIDLSSKMDFGFSSLQNQLDSARLDYTPRREHGLLVDRVKKVERKVGISASRN